MQEIWNKQKEQKEAMTPIIPILFYHGEKKWKQNKFEDMFKVTDDKIRPFLPSFEYYLIDLSNYTDEQILNLRYSFLINTLLTLKHYKEKKYILDKIDLVFSLTLKEHEWNLYSVLLRYITWNNKFSEMEQQKIVDEVQEPIKNTIMNTYQDLIQKGLEKGLEKGIQKGENNMVRKTVLNMDKNGFEITQIALALDISKEKVIEILNEKETDKM